MVVKRIVASGYFIVLKVVVMSFAVAEARNCT